MRYKLLIVLFLLVGQFWGVVSAAENSDEKKENRINLIKQIPLKEMIIFSPGKDKVQGVVTVFTDLDCGYCKELHDDTEKLMQQGIEVRYLAYPRQGVGSSSYTKMVSIWCSRDRAEAMGLAMKGQFASIATCANPIAKHLAIGKKIGLVGTPTVIFEDGTLYSGYDSPESLARQAIKYRSHKD
jgi:thiol:disulfide interchange protein DsbC